MAAAVVFAGGKLYGDDMNIVNEHEVLSYPQDFSVYPYHMELLKLNDHTITRDFRRTALLNRITDVLERYNSRPAKLASVVLNSLKVPVVNVPPRRIFGDQCFAKRGVVDEVYYLLRADVKSKGFSIRKVDPAKLAGICTNILFHEWHECLRFLYVYSALSSFSIDKLYSNTKAVFEHLFATRPCHLMEIPASMKNFDYQAELLRHLYREDDS